MTLLDRQKEIAGYLVAGFPELGLRGWDLAGACAVVGNYTQENLCKAVATGPLDHGSQGIAQWRLDRLTELKSWCARYSGSWENLKAQSAFTLFETARDYPSLDAELRMSMEGVKPADMRKALDHKVSRFCFEFERPSKALAGLSNRQQHAASAYAVMSGKIIPTVDHKVVPSVVTGTVGAGAGGAAVTGTVIAASSGAVDAPAIISFAISLILAIITAFLANREKSPKTATVAESPLHRLYDALEKRALANAEVAEASDALRDSLDEANSLLSQAGAQPLWTTPSEHPKLPEIKE